jgi:hypothetical protein
MRTSKWIGIIAMLSALGCNGADGSCEDLAEVCATCPDTPDGNQARASCEFAVEKADELACEDRIDREIYAPYGCQY